MSATCASQIILSSHKPLARASLSLSLSLPCFLPILVAHHSLGESVSTFACQCCLSVCWPIDESFPRSRMYNWAWNRAHSKSYCSSYSRIECIFVLALDGNERHFLNIFKWTVSYLSAVLLAKALSKCLFTEPELLGSSWVWAIALNDRVKTVICIWPDVPTKQLASKAPLWPVARTLANNRCLLLVITDKHYCM